MQPGEALHLEAAWQHSARRGAGQPGVPDPLRTSQASRLPARRQQTRWWTSAALERPLRRSRTGQPRRAPSARGDLEIENQMLMAMQVHSVPCHRMGCTLQPHLGRGGGDPAAALVVHAAWPCPVRWRWGRPCLGENGVVSAK